MKRWHCICALMLCVCFLASTLSACNPKTSESVQAADKSIYASFFPLYALTEPLVKDVDDVRLNCLVQPQDGCLRAYQLSDWDLSLVATADAVIAGGCGLESYENILYALSENGPVVDPVFYGMELTLMPGANTQSDTDSHWLDANPHIYMSVSQAAAITERIAEFLCVWDAEHEEVYRKNLENAKNHLDSLRNTLSGQLEEAEIPPVIIMNEALVYFMQDYDLDIAMCYERESGEDFNGTELEMCIAALKNSGGKYILLEKQAPQSLCKALTNAGFVPVKMDVMSTRRAQEGFEGYCKAMQENVQTLLEALKTA